MRRYDGEKKKNRRRPATSSPRRARGLSLSKAAELKWKPSTDKTSLTDQTNKTTFLFHLGPLAFILSPYTLHLISYDEYRGSDTSAWDGCAG